MRALDHREPGILGIVLTTDELFAELICDGVHTAPEMVKLWWRAKGPERAILVTDAMSATGMPDGEYQLGGMSVQVAHGRATAGGVLAGSVLTLDKALTNFVKFTGTPLTTAVAAANQQPGDNDRTWAAGGFPRRWSTREPGGIGTARGSWWLRSPMGSMRFLRRSRKKYRLFLANLFRNPGIDGFGSDIPCHLPGARNGSG